MPTLVNTQNPSFETFEIQSLFTRYRLSGCPMAREEALTWLLTHTQLMGAVKKQALGELRARLGADSPAYHLVRENMDSTIGCALVVRFDHLVLFDPEVSSLAGFVARQVVYYHNDHERDFVNRSVGYVRGSQEAQVSFCGLTFSNAEGEETELPLTTEGPSLEEQAERNWELSWLSTALSEQNDAGVQWLRVFLEHGVLDEDCPAQWTQPGVIQLRWKHQGQKWLAEKLGVTTRTLRNHTKKVEETLIRWSQGF